MSCFDACLPLLLAHEGGYVDDPRDPGGATNLGVTLAALSAFRGRACTKDDVRALRPAMVAPIYRANYWRPACCDQLPAGVDHMTFDMAVNSGPGRAKRFLQGAANVAQDGVIGPQTLAAIQREGAWPVIARFAALREAYFRSLPDFDHFGHGWLNRLNAVTAEAKAMAGVS